METIRIKNHDLPNYHIRKTFWFNLESETCLRSFFLNYSQKNGFFIDNLIKRFELLGEKYRLVSINDNNNNVLQLAYVDNQLSKISGDNNRAVTIYRKTIMLIFFNCTYNIDFFGRNLSEKRSDDWNERKRKSKSGSRQHVLLSRYLARSYWYMRYCCMPPSKKEDFRRNLFLEKIWHRPPPSIFRKIDKKMVHFFEFQKISPAAS